MTSNTTEIQACLDRLATGDTTARATIIRLAQDRLSRLASRMLKGFPSVRKWEETDDVYQNAMIRLHSALRMVTPQTTEDFLRLAAVQIRRELIDLSRHYFGPQGMGTHQKFGQYCADHLANQAGNLGSDTHDPYRLDLWTEFHTYVERLPDNDRVYYDLLWYQGLTQQEASTILNVSERTVQRRWQLLRIQMHEALGSQVDWNS